MSDPFARLFMTSTNRQNPAIQHHASIAAAVAAGDADAAADIARTHFALTESVVRELMRTVGNAEPEVAT